MQRRLAALVPYIGIGSLRKKKPGYFNSSIIGGHIQRRPAALVPYVGIDARCQDAADCILIVRPHGPK